MKIRYSLGDYTLDEIKEMDKPFGNHNYDVYDGIMFNVASKYDEILNNDELVKQDKELFTALKGVTMFAFGYSANKRNYVKDIEKAQLTHFLMKADKVCKKDSESLAVREYFNLRHCLSEYLQRTAGLDINANKTIKR